MPRHYHAPGLGNRRLLRAPRLVLQAHPDGGALGLGEGRPRGVSGGGKEHAEERSREIM